MVLEIWTDLFPFGQNARVWQTERQTDRQTDRQHSRR